MLLLMRRRCVLEIGFLDGNAIDLGTGESGECGCVGL